MIVVQLRCGLGNQMFQYAVGRAIAHRNNVPLKLDISFLDPRGNRPYALHYFNIVEEFATDEDINRLIPYRRNMVPYFGSWVTAHVRNHFLPYHLHTVVAERGYRFDPEVLRVRDRAYLLGFWQSEKYFEDVAWVIRSELTWKTGPDETNRAMLDEIEATHSVAVHIRRGDYTSDAGIAKFGLLGLDYYREAVTLIRKEVSDPHFFVFSDDPEWAAKNLSIPFPHSFVDHNNGPAAAHEDLRLMCSCKHHIIANSSFSWWGAWLAEWPGQMVIAPKVWFVEEAFSPRDIVPDRWRKL